MANDQKGGTLHPAVRDRLMGHIDPFIDALDEAVANPSDEALEDAREAADQLMLSVARVMIELGKES